MKLPPLVMKEIEALGNRARIEDGAKHIHVLVDGRLAAVMPRSCVRENKRSELNGRAQIRRAARAEA